MTNPPNRIWKYLQSQKPGNSGNGHPHQPAELPPAIMPTEIRPDGPPLVPYPLPYLNSPPPQQVPQLQAAPPETPPPVSGGGDGDGDDSWSFPNHPPMGSPAGCVSPFVVRHLSTALPEHPMYAVATVPFYENGMLAHCSQPGYPPPLVIGYWVYPIQYFEIQIRQYFSPAGPFIPTDLAIGGFPDYDEDAFRKLGWTAGSPSTNRWPVFQYSSGGQFINFESTILDTPFSDWRLATVDRYQQDPVEIVESLVEESRLFWLHPNWLRTLPTPNSLNSPNSPFTNLPLLYEQARQEGSPLFCVTPGWKGDTDE